MSVCSLGLPVIIMSWAGQAPPPFTQETINIYQVPTTHRGSTSSQETTVSRKDPALLSWLSCNETHEFVASKGCKEMRGAVGVRGNLSLSRSQGGLP